MGNLTNIPLEQNYEEELTQTLSPTDTEVYVKAVPNFTFPAGSSVDFIIDAGKTKEETITVTAIDTVNKKLTISARNVSRGAGVTSTAQSHSVGSKIIISNGYNLWLSTQTAINSKLNNDGSGVGTSFDLQVSGSSFRIRKDVSDMKFSDDNNNEISLSTIAQLSGADTKVSISTNDTNTSQLENKLIAGDGISLTKNNAGGNETLTSAIDLDTNSGLEFNNGKLKAKSDATLQKTFTAGENINVGDAVRMGTDLLYIDYSLNGLSHINYDANRIGYSSTFRAVGQSFIADGDRKLYEVEVDIIKNGSPSGNLTMYLYSDTGNTLLATSTNTIAESGLSSSGQVSFLFNDYQLVSGNTYYLKISTDRSDSTSNFTLWVTTSSTNSGTREGDGYTINSSNSWGTGSYASERGARVKTKIIEDHTKIFKSSASVHETTKLIGFANETINSGNTGKVNIAGITGNQTSLTIGSDYYLSNTAGDISTSAGTNSLKIGTAISNTEILILDRPQRLTSNNLIVETISGTDNIRYYSNTYLISSERALVSISSNHKSNSFEDKVGIEINGNLKDFGMGGGTIEVYKGDNIKGAMHHRDGYNSYDGYAYLCIQQ